MTDVVSPIVHLNGTSAERLIEQLSDVYDAAEQLYAALKQAAPNGRDYYPEPGRLERAIAQHRQRMAAVQAIQASVEAEIAAIEAQR